MTILRNFALTYGLQVLVVVVVLFFIGTAIYLYVDLHRSIELMNNLDEQSSTQGLQVFTDSSGQIGSGSTVTTTAARTAPKKD